MSTTTPVVTSSTTADETFLAYDQVPQVWNSPSTPQTLREFDFTPGFGHDTINVLGLMPSPSVLSNVLVPAPAPYIIKMGAGIQPGDLAVFSLPDVHVPADPSLSRGHVPTYAAWQTSWLIKVAGSTDQLVINDFFTDYANDGSAPDPAVLHGVPRSLVGIQFADGTVWSPEQVQALLTRPDAALRHQLSGTAGDDVLNPGMSDDAIDLTGGGQDTLIAHLGDGNDTVTGSLSELRLGAGIQRGDVQLSQDGQVFVTSQGRVGYTLKADHLDHIALADGTVIGQAELLLAAQWGGSPLDDTIQGDAQNNVIHGGAGNDTLSGGAGNDVLYGDAGRNLLNGGEGNDTLVATGVQDGLVGGVGSDVYDLRQGTGYATITEAVGDVGQDQVLLGRTQADTALRLDQLGNLHIMSKGDELFGADTAVPFAYDVAGVNGFLGAQAGSVSIEQLVFGDGTALNASGLLSAALSGNELNNLIVGTDWNDLLQGRSGNDRLLAGAGNDTLIGGTGNDDLTGGAGNDTFNWSRGDGFDVIHSSNDGSGDTLAFAAGINRSDVAVVLHNMTTTGASTVDLVLRDGSGGVTLSNLTPDGSPSADTSLLTVTFGDGSKVKASDLIAKARSTASSTGNDDLWAGLTDLGVSLQGANGADWLCGGRGADTLDGGIGADTLIGGKGADLLTGGKGADTYLFGRGDGQDTIVDTDSTWFVTDTLKLTDITSRQLWFKRQGNDLDIQVIGSNGADDIHVQNWFGGTANQIERIVASDGKALSASKVQGLVNAMASLTPPATADISAATTSTSLNKLVASSWV